MVKISKYILKRICNRNTSKYSETGRNCLGIQDLGSDQSSGKNFENLEPTNGRWRFCVSVHFNHWFALYGRNLYTYTFHDRFCAVQS